MCTDLLKTLHDMTKKKKKKSLFLQKINIKQSSHHTYYVDILSTKIKFYLNFKKINL